MQFVYLLTIIQKLDAVQMAAFVGESRSAVEKAARDFYGPNLKRLFPETEYNIHFTVERLYP